MRTRLPVSLLPLLFAHCAPVPALVDASGAPVEKVVFFGDSLIHRADADHGLLGRVQSELARREPALRPDLYEAGRNGDDIADLKERLADDVLARRPDVVVLYWDSDVSDVDESGLTRSQVGALRAAYESNLAAVLGEIQAAGARVIVSGPSLLGERPHGQNPKDAQLDAYVSINRRLAVRFKGRYLDTRRLLLEHAGSSAGPLTEDGEHLSDAGVRLLAVELAKALGEALRSRRSS